MSLGHAYHNILTGELPLLLGNLTQLVTFVISFNLISDFIPILSMSRSSRPPIVATPVLPKQL